MPSRRYPLQTFLRMEGPHLSRLERVLRSSYEQVTAEILAASRTGGGAAAQLTRLQLEAQRASIKSYLDRGFTDLEDIVANGQRDAAAAASRVVSTYEEQLTKLVLDPAERRALATSEAERAAAGVQNAMRRIQGDSYIPLSDQVYRTGTLVRGQVDKIVDSALTRGVSWQQFAAEVRPFINPDTPGGATYASRRLARTEINNAFHAASARRYAESPMVEGVDWNKSNSHPENDICDELEEESPYDVQEVPAKPHPHCLCFITPALPSEDDFLENLFAGKYDDPDSEPDAAPSPTGLALRGLSSA